MSYVPLTKPPHYQLFLTAADPAVFNGTPFLDPYPQACTPVNFFNPGSLAKPPQKVYSPEKKRAPPPKNFPDLRYPRAPESMYSHLQNSYFYIYISSSPLSIPNQNPNPNPPPSNNNTPKTPPAFASVVETPARQTSSV